jgi:hypothetical protein
MDTCPHVAALPVPPPHARTPAGCEECLRTGRVRPCLTCGHIGCCDSSPGRRATVHHHETAHSVVRSFQPGEDRRRCHVGEVIG